MASEKAHHPWSRPDQVDEETSHSGNSSISEAKSTDEEPPAYTGMFETGESSNTPPLSSTQQQPKRTVAIPAVDSSFNSPFIRAYAPILKDYNLPQEVFLSFLDRLNKAIANSPPLQVLDATGGLLSSVPILFPLHWIGSAVSGIANLGNLGVSKSRTDTFLRDSNRDIFGPRGLKIEIAKLDALAHIAKIPILDSRGKVSLQSPLLQQLMQLRGSVGSSGGDWDDDQNDGSDMSFDAQQQRIRILQPWIAELELDILPWTSESRLTRFNAALKKHNNRDSRGGPRGARHAKKTLVNANDEEDDPFRKCLWLIIRETNAQSESSK
ncbi:hypothetical protein UA08_06834 [Talaromyces atroroseus]|uniref:Uncharacterized protein n=1 Tax=Talaromyces atroroseus TaxID=1441469 RepID=A0A225AG90_TALAT|nr:hypothetical protein UA08_06834 [Talaromyces atroroseus]OKL58173.1 hypothetical protein UA08_06834 [Talaromyces atroroseus]